MGPADLSEAKSLCIHETTEVIIVRKDGNFMLAAFQIVTPRLKRFDDSQKLIVVGLVSSLGRNHFPRKEGYWVPLVKWVLVTILSGLVSEASWLKTPPMA